MVTSLTSAPSTYIPHGLDADTNKELSAAWSQVQARVVALAGGDPKRIKPLGIDGVLGQLDRAQKSEKESPAKETVRKTFHRTLALVQTVGGIAAGAASSVFGPSELCFNALSFVIDAWKGYRGVFDELAGLLEKCTDYLSRLQYHVQGGMDANLSKVACQHLLLFVEICDRTVKLRSKRMKLLAVSKMFFFREDSVTDLLDKMANLVDKEGRLVAAQTFSLASDAAASSKANLALTQGLVDSMAEDKAEQRREKDKVYRTQTILRSLAFDESKLNADRTEPEPFWQTIYRNYLGQRVLGTGEWVFDHAAYTAWEYGRSESPVLAIEGGEGSGKSFLASTIINRLRQQKVKEGADTRIATAFYFLEGDSREELKNATNLENVAKSLVWQFSQVERLYLKSAASICETLGEIDPADISRYLLFGNEDLAKMDITLFIVIDGLGDAVGEGMIRFLQRACSAPPGQDIRVLLTGDSRCFEQLAKVDDVAFDTISISCNNQSDVENYIERQMDRMPVVADRSRFGIPELRSRIRSRLSEQTKGDFFKIDTTLTHIGKLEYITDIEDALENASKERSQQIIEEIESLNENRSEKEIAEINEIILWIVYCRGLLSPKEMAAALYVKSGERSLLPLEQKFKMKYPLFEINNNGRIDFRSSEIEDFIPVKSHSHASDDQYDAKTTHPAEVAMVKHFLVTVCPPDVYAKFNFDDYLAQKSSRKSTSVFKDDPHTGETKMALACLHVLTQELDKKRMRLLPYARKYLLKHLAAVDLALADITCKSRVGSRLVQLFTEDSSIDRLLDGDESTSSPAVHRKVRDAWIYDDDSVDIVVRWLGDSAVVSGISDEQRQWVDALLQNKSFERDLLVAAARQMAVHFVQEPHFKPFTKDSFLFLLGYVNKIESEKDSRETPVEPFTPTVEQVDQAERWCELALQVQAKNSLWHVQIGILLDQFGYTNEAASRAREALALDSLDWRASNLLADVVSPDEGIAILNPVAERLQQDTPWLASLTHKMDLAKLLFSLGSAYWSTGQHDLAIPVFTTAMHTDYTDYGRIYQVVGLYAAEHRWSDITTSLQTIQSSPPQSDTNPLADVLIHLAPYVRFHQSILSAALHTQSFPLLESAYELAISHLHSQDLHRPLSFLRYHYGTAMYSLRDRESKALAQWELAFQENIPHCGTSSSLPLLISKLGPVYLHHARSAGPDRTAAETYLDKLSSLIPDSSSPSSSSTMESLFPPHLYLARYHHTLGNHAQARDLVRPIISQALEILSDEDENNDIPAYITLLCVFIPLEDDANARAAFTLLARMQGPAGRVSCDGDCGMSWAWEEKKELFWCRDCVALTLEKGCLGKVRGEGLLLSVCEGGHEFWGVGDGDGDGDGDGVALGEWVEGVRKAYLG
ncbi:hypothetical protein P170DRAFT_510250 [Aspergillus steynii IBT 23096]|uniref:Uncharacterized protein n=1 Tax=Aspergillus steynii IBT 23096 TaxID=1392250 RepID=A0A2I2GA89_9EURO|nr:uncharacterized protein P170DRAFT_510250 [Aspergillus steynii IBT 23096]PLB49788.1 hypothetical protein P170DRAFT_510250 [Aspergillus steynii IBT 23096]